MSLDSVAELLTYALSLSEADSNAAKFFFANGRTFANGKSLALAGPAAMFLTAAAGTTDAYGVAYHHPAGSNGADPLGDSRPFQTEPESDVPSYSGMDYFGAPTTNTAYLSGSAADITKSPAFPSGHTTYGYTESVLLGVMVPERYPQMVARAAEYGNDRIVLGAHYAMDVIGGRTLALYDLAHLFAGYPAYAGLQFGQSTIGDFGVALAAARNDLRKALSAGCGDTLAACANDAKNRFGDPAAVRTFYESTQTYGLPVVFDRTAGTVEDVGKIAPEAGSLLTVAFPALSIAQADRVLTETEGPGGGFLDDGSCFGVYSRLNLYEAALRAEKLAASP
jgi:membrane-associated phospholipid phosphatase